MKRQHQDDTNGSNKKLDSKFDTQEIQGFFNPKIWSDSFQNSLRDAISSSSPYKWGTITELMDDNLLRQVRKEVLTEIAFTKKETDIYKVFQSGDLANLSGLNWDDLSRLPSLYKLRAGIYSQEFRDFISKVTGSGKLSGIKTDMSINTYNKGCHLLTHDDVIGSRRVSFILYLPDPDKEWKEQNGGALRLFPSIVPNVPSTDFECKLVPQFNQIAFFTVQPGLSFHDVEEVRVDKQRLSIQGWFHIPQKGEPGFIEGEQEATEARSTLQMLQSKDLQEFDYPKLERNEIVHPFIKPNETINLSKEDLNYLQKYINPAYLIKTNLEQLQHQLDKDSIVEISSFLNDEFAHILRKQLSYQELEMDTPQKSTEISHPWKIATPPHKQRYMYIDGKAPFVSTEESVKNQLVGPTELPNFKLLQLNSSETDTKLIEIATLFQSSAFRRWILLVTGLITTADQILIRRFRPGQDFILATTTEKEIARNEQELNVLLEATLNLTPSAIKKQNWESGEYGGYELCMAMDEDGDDDPAIYRSGSPNDDSVLYTSQCKWNSLTLFLRDPSVLKFVKYVSINAKGSRWDLNCQWNVKELDDDDDDEEVDDEEENKK